MHGWNELLSCYQVEWVTECKTVSREVCLCTVFPPVVEIREGTIRCHLCDQEKVRNETHSFFIIHSITILDIDLFMKCLQKSPDLLSDELQCFFTKRFTQTAPLALNAHQQHKTECVPPLSLRSRTVSPLLSMNGGEYVCAFALIIFSLSAGHILLYDAVRKNRWLTSNISLLISFLGFALAWKEPLDFAHQSKKKEKKKNPMCLFLCISFISPVKDYEC